MVSLFSVTFLSTGCITVTENALIFCNKIPFATLNKDNLFCFSPEINATGFNYQNEDEKVTLSFPSTLQKGQAALSQTSLLFNVLFHCRSDRSSVNVTVQLSFVRVLHRLWNVEDRLRGRA